MGFLASIIRTLFGDQSRHKSTSSPSASTTVTPPPSPSYQLPARKSPLESFYASLPSEFPVCGYTVRISRSDKGLAVNVSQEGDGDRMADILGDSVEATRDEVRAFLRFYLKTQIGPTILTFSQHGEINCHRLHVINMSLEAWRKISGPRDKSGRLKNSVRCIAWTEGEGPGGHVCGKFTKDPTGLCHLHNKPNARTLWTFDPFREMDSRRDQIKAASAIINAQAAVWEAHEKAREAEEKRQREADNAAWEAKWRPIATRIRHDATERQIFYLLELGAKPHELEGIDKRRASEMIDRLNDEEYERRGWT